ncbi:helix-turn-helix domain-containing protein [Streptomyces sp. TRM 70351]|uniref:PucR family transcriptional regulator n=1 Tax=Streptomyces sp. TRM 70351 TaxID=3116552 RepID=UPI002E7BD4D1|nr:helix-turn-helix domain-containing protein [Streptomyces sp. TRM 70351]MEE1927883.1 helix-turn-helix domain-containing protein [Streptomyces sp. TRM 70351]
MQPDVLSPARTPHDQTATAQPTGPRQDADAEAVAVLHRAARGLIEDLAGLTDRLVAFLNEREPSYRAAIAADAEDVWQEAHRALRYNVGSLLHPRQYREPARRCAWQIGTRRAEHGMPLAALQHAFRRGGAIVWQGLIEQTERRRPEDVRLLVHSAAYVWNSVDEHCALVADAYREAERQLTWRRENALRLMTEALLDGTTRIADLPEVAAALDLPENGRYAVAVLTGEGRAAHRENRPASGPGGLRLLWHTGAGADHAIALLGENRPADLARALPGAPGGLRVGVSSAVEGLAALGDARRCAGTALRCCTEETPVVVLDEHLPAALTVSSPELGAALADRVLGPLLRLDPADRDVLLNTLTAWLECDGSAPRAGARLYCHRNTVLNRLRRCEQLTGRSLSRPADLVQLSLALTARRLLDG